MKKTLFLLLLFALGCAARPAPVVPAAKTSSPYQKESARIIAAALTDDGAWEKLAHLTDNIGNRLSGSSGLTEAIEWAARTMEAEGHENVRQEPVLVPHWTRGAESAQIVAPVKREMSILGLGGTIATAKAGLTADVVVFDNFDELEAAGEKAVKGKIVLFNRPMPAYSPEKGAGYGETVKYRTGGPVAAAKLGAVGTLVRSVTAHSLRTPHTGATRYEEGVKRIPAAAVTVEDAELIARLAKKGNVRVTLRTSGKWHPDAPSANVVGEIVGREKPEEIVLIGAHIDSWDVGQGAHDDGTGVVIMMQALTVLRRLELRPRRTIRVVLFTNEENGLGGARTYATAHAATISNHVVAMESDSGGFKPVGFRVQGTAHARNGVAAIAKLLAPVEASTVAEGYSGADLRPLTAAGVPGLGLWVEGSKYFDYHHTHADTLDKVDPQHLKMNVAAVATMAYVLAERPERIDAENKAPDAGATE